MRKIQKFFGVLIVGMALSLGLSACNPEQNLLQKFNGSWEESNGDFIVVDLTKKKLKMVKPSAWVVLTYDVEVEKMDTENDAVLLKLTKITVNGETEAIDQTKPESPKIELQYLSSSEIQMIMQPLGFGTVFTFKEPLK